MPTIDLIYRPGCSNIGATRVNLLTALTRARLPARWREWNADDPETPRVFRDYGSPTVLIDGRDVAASGIGASGASCRIYATELGAAAGVPTARTIMQALRNGGESDPAVTPARTGLAAAVPAVSLALLPKLTCPLCFPAYAAALGALGLGFFDYTPYLLPVTAAFLALSLVLLGRLARSRGTFVPLGVGIAAAATILAGKFMLDSDVALYAGAAMLVSAPLVPRRRGGDATCRDCITDQHEEKRT